MNTPPAVRAWLFLATLLLLPAAPPALAAAPAAPENGAGAAAPGAALFPPEYAKKRPRPADLNFFRVKDDLQAHVNRLPAGLKAGEKKRIEILSTVRAYLVKLMKFIPYDGTRVGVRLDNGKVFKASVMGNEEELVLRPRRGKSKIVRWEELPPSQYAVMLEYYGRYRLEHEAAGKPGAASLKSRQQEAAWDWFRAALLSDWYGSAAEARRLGRAALDLDPGLKPQAEALLPWILPPAPEETTPELQPAAKARE